MEKDSYISQLAQFVTDIRFDDIPGTVVDKVKLCLVDALECCVSPMIDIRGNAAYESVRKGVENGATLICRGQKADSCDAAYFNTVKGSTTNRNDIQMDAGVHAGAVVVPTVLAVCEEEHKDGKTLIEAILAGYEAMIRFGSFLSGRMNKAWRTTAVFSPVGCAFAASKVMGLSQYATMSAASIACHSCSGFNEWAISGTGEDVFQNASGARNGIWAAKLAKAGAQGCPSIIEGPSGLGVGFGIHDGYGKLVRDMGVDWTIERVMHKPIDSCIIVQTPCQCAKKLIDANPELEAGDIKSIQIEASRQYIGHPGCANKEIRTLVQGVMSICLGVCSTIYNKSYDKIGWEPPIAEEIASLMERCTLIENPEYTERCRSAVRITVETLDGKSFSNQQDSLIPLTDDEVWLRFHNTCLGRIGEKRTERLEEMIHNIENVKDVSELAALLQ